MDYWYTNDPSEIERFLRNLSTTMKYDFSGWTHFSDYEFLYGTGDVGGKGLTYSDKTKSFYLTWSAVENETVVVYTREFPHLIIPELTFSISASQISINNTKPDLSALFSGAGILSGIGEETMYSKAFGTWLGKDMKFHSQKWGGNQYTGGKLAYAGKYANFFKWAGIGAAAANQGYLYYLYDNQQMPKKQFYYESTSNWIGALPVVGIGWSIGWELGRLAGRHLKNR